MISSGERIIDLDDAIDLISITLERHKTKSILPYFFIVGAGISIPEIPSAKEIVDLCMRKVEKENKQRYLEETKKPNVSKIENYSNWMKLAYPNKINRKDFLKKLISSSRISSANLMLAQILYSNKIASTVFTTNFDDQIKQALDLIGAKDVFVSENTMDNLVIDIHCKEIQIVHVHGTYNFYDCANLKSEIVNNANQEGTISPTQILENFLHAQTAPIIIGYSGWEEDVIMMCLKERLKYPTPVTYIWVCYSQDDYEQIPDKIKENENIVFVLPKQDTSICEDKYNMENENPNKSFLLTPEKNDGGGIRATLFLSKIIANLEIAPQMIFSNPYSYFSKMINSILPDDDDVWYLKYWAQRMQYLGASDSLFDILVKNLGQAFVTKNIDHAAEVINQLSETELTNADLKCVLISVIVEYLKSKNVMKSTGSIIPLYCATFNFIEKKHQQLIDINILKDVLYILLFNENTYLFKDNEHIKIIDRIYSISNKYEYLLDLHINSIYKKSFYVDDDKEKKKLLEQAIEKCLENNSRIEIKHILFGALLELSKLKYNNEAIEVYEEAKKISDEIIATFNKKEKNDIEDRMLNSVFNTLFIVKSKILFNITNEKILIEWVSELLSAIENPDSKISYRAKVEIIINIAKLPEYVMQCIENLERVFIEYVDPDKKVYIKNDRKRATIYMAIFTISAEPKTKFEYCNKLFELENTLFREYRTFKVEYLNAISCYCSLPIAIVPDSSKIPYLIKFREMLNELSFNKSLFYETFAIGIKNGDEKKYKESELADDIDSCKEFHDANEKLIQGYKKYCDKNFETAETIFNELLSCDIQNIKGCAYNNLAFMVRRNETRNKIYSFEQLIGNVSDDFGTKHINNILYYLAHDEQNNPNYRIALDALNELPKEELKEVIKFWSDISLVGPEESSLVMEILKKEGI